MLKTKKEVRDFIDERAGFYISDVNGEIETGGRAVIFNILNPELEEKAAIPIDLARELVADGYLIRYRRYTYYFAATKVEKIITTTSGDITVEVRPKSGVILFFTGEKIYLVEGRFLDNVDDYLVYLLELDPKSVDDELVNLIELELANEIEKDGGYYTRKGETVYLSDRNVVLTV